MNRQLANAVVDFISLPDTERASALSTFSLRQWRSSMHWLVTSGMALCLLEALKQAARVDVLPPAVGDTLEQMWAGSALRIHSLERDLLQLNQRFSELGLRYTNWKGFAAVPDFCPDIQMRAFSDFDFLIEKHKAELFDAAIRDFGYVTVSISDDEIAYEKVPGMMVRFERTYHDSPRRRIELHPRVNAAIGGQNVCVHSGILQRRSFQQRLGVPFPVLDPADAFILHALHIAKHFLDGWVRLGWLLEFRHFVRAHAGNHEVWRKVTQRAEQASGLGNAASRNADIVAVAALLTDCVFQIDDNKFLRSAIDGLPAGITLWFQRFGRKAALADFPGTKLPLLLLRELLPDDECRSFVNRRLLPLKRPSQVARAQGWSPKQHATAARLQLRFTWMRLRYHVVEGVRYMAEKRRWDNALLRMNTRPTSITT